MPPFKWLPGRSNGCKQKQPIYKDAKAPIEERVNDLVSRMTLEEKVQQLNQYTLGRNNNENNRGEEVKKIPATLGSLIYFDEDANLRNEAQRKAMEESRLGIPILSDTTSSTGSVPFIPSLWDKHVLGIPNW